VAMRAVLRISAVVALSLLSGGCGTAKGHAAPQPRPGHQQALRGVPDGPANAGAKGMVQVTLPVTKIPAQFAVENGTEAPRAVTVSIPAAWKGAVGAYWAGVILLGPVGWTGSATFGADGSGFVNLHPPGGGPESGPRVDIQTAGACLGCGDGSAAEYFPYVAQHWSQFQVIEGPPPKPIKVLSEVSLSPTLVAYRLPNASDGLEINGIAYSGLVHHVSVLPFVQMNVELPASDHALATIILNYFIAHDVVHLP
jgi:hypothetical protein